MFLSHVRAFEKALDSEETELELDPSSPVHPKAPKSRIKRVAASSDFAPINIALS